MRGHLTEEEITRFAAHLIKGRERVSILTHLEMCEMCRARISPPSQTEITERLKADDAPVECECEKKSVRSD
jgi:hypothetical protein